MTTKSTAKAAVYLRISVDRSGEELGVTRQREDCLALASRLGWTVAEVYTDNDLSAYSGKTRPGFEALLDSMKRGEVDALIVWHVDRLYRSMKDLERLIDIADEHRIQLRTVSGGDLDLSNATGRMLARILGSVSRNESEHKAERQRRAFRQIAERGIPRWRRAFGYLDTPDGPVIDPKAAPLVKEAYAAVLSGCSLGDVVRSLNAAGAYSLNGTPWTQSTLSLFLRKARNAGLRTYGGEIVGKGLWPPLVDEDTWRAAQAVLNAPGRAPGRKSVQRYLLTGVLRCGKCGGALGGTWTTQGTITYQCRGDRGCHGTSIRAEHVEPLVYSIIADRLAMDDAIGLLKAEVHDTAEAETIRLELESLYTRLDEIAVERGEGLLTGKQAKVASDVVNAKVANLQARQHDSEKLRVFEGLPLGEPEVHEAVKALSADRFRAVIGVLCDLTVLPVGKGGHAFRPERVKVEWRS